MTVRFLIVDDHPLFREALQLAIQSAYPEAEIVEASSIAAAQAALATEQPFDLLLLDLTMPGRDPIEAIQEVREAYPALRIVVHSGSSDPLLLDRARKAGASQLALKALDLDETLAVIRGDSR